MICVLGRSCQMPKDFRFPCYGVLIASLLSETNEAKRFMSTVDIKSPVIYRKISNKLLCNIHDIYLFSKICVIVFQFTDNERQKRKTDPLYFTQHMTNK